MLIRDLLISEQFLLPIFIIRQHFNNIAGDMLTAFVIHTPFESIKVFMRFYQPFLHQ